MTIKVSRTRLMVASAVGVITILASASPAFAASPSGTQEQTYTVQDASGCTETFTVSESLWTPIVGDSQYRVDAEFTKNPCGLTNGLEAGLTATTVVGGVTGTDYGGDVHKVGTISEASADANLDYCNQYGARWWNGSSWDYYWWNC
jgi:hypothetical protein